MALIVPPTVPVPCPVCTAPVLLSLEVIPGPWWDRGEIHLEGDLTPMREHVRTHTEEPARG